MRTELRFAGKSNNVNIFKFLILLFQKNENTNMFVRKKK